MPENPAGDTPLPGEELKVSTQPKTTAPAATVGDPPQNSNTGPGTPPGAGEPPDPRPPSGAAASKSSGPDRQKASSNAENADTDRATKALLELAKLNNPTVYTPAIISYIVVLGFFLVLGALLFKTTGSNSSAGGQGSNGDIQIVNICVGALAAAFATVMNFWLGSSLGSQSKDSSLLTSNSVDHIKSLRASQSDGSDH